MPEIGLLLAMATYVRVIARVSVSMNSDSTKLDGIELCIEKAIIDFCIECGCQYQAQEFFSCQMQLLSDTVFRVTPSRLTSQVHDTQFCQLRLPTGHLLVTKVILQLRLFKNILKFRIPEAMCFTFCVKQKQLSARDSIWRMQS